MKIKKILKNTTLLLLILTFALSAALIGGCAKRGTEEPSFAEDVAEKILISINKNDYESIKEYLNEDFKSSLKNMVNIENENKPFGVEADGFNIGIAKALKDKIGEYTEGSIVFDRTLTEKGYTSVFYITKFAKETSGDVLYQLVFQEVSGKWLVGGMWFSSKTLQQ